MNGENRFRCRKRRIDDGLDFGECDGVESDGRDCELGDEEKLIKELGRRTGVFIESEEFRQDILRGQSQLLQI
jgi:hypothetical protein